MEPEWTGIASSRGEGETGKTDIECVIVVVVLSFRLETIMRDIFPLRFHSLSYPKALGDELRRAGRIFFSSFVYVRYVSLHGIE